MSDNLLEKDAVCPVSLRLARRWGLESAFLLQQINYHARKAERESAQEVHADGRFWVRLPAAVAAEWLGCSEKSATRLLAALRDAGLLLARQLHPARDGRTLYYAVDVRAVAKSVHSLPNLAPALPSAATLPPKPKSRYTKKELAEYASNHKLEGGWLNQALTGVHDDLIETMLLKEQIDLEKRQRDSGWARVGAHYD